MDAMADACVRERSVICVIWSQIELLLCSKGTSAAALIRTLTAELPDVNSVSCQDLRELARLHVSSAANMTSTMRLFAPAAFTKDACEPDVTVLAQLPTGVLDMVSNLIELQLFHLQRAAALTAQSRQRLTSLQSTAMSTAFVSNSSSGSASTLDSAHSSTE